MTATPETTQSPAVPTLSPRDVVDRYRVDRKLGEGGMAAVYRVQHLQLGSWHALKVVSVASPTVAKRLLQEGRVQARLQHVNVVGVTDVVDVRGSPGLVLEYVAGPTLSDLVGELHPMSAEQLDHLALGVLRGVEVAHALGFAHRDLKPANVLLAEGLDGPIPKVADFGLAKVLEGAALDSTRPNIAMGTPSYMAPEQIEDAKSADTRADVFSLGAILYELAAGRRCFSGNSVFEIFRKVGNADFVPLRSLRPDLPDRIHDAVVAALTVDRAARPQTVGALRELWTGPGWTPPSGNPFGDQLDPIFAPFRASLEPFSPEPAAVTPAPAARAREVGANRALVSVEPAPGATTAVPYTPPPHDATDLDLHRTFEGTSSAGASSQPPPTELAEAPAGTVPWRLLAIGLLLVFAIGTLGGIAAGLGGLRDPSPEPVAAIEEPPPVTMPEPLPPTPSAPEPPPVPVAKAKSKSRPAPAVPAPAPPDPAPAPAAGPHGMVLVVGEDVTVWLVPQAGGDRRRTGAVPPGEYRIEASFGDSNPIPQGKLTVVEGEARTIRCNANMKTCRI